MNRGHAFLAGACLVLSGPGLFCAAYLSTPVSPPADKPESSVLHLACSAEKPVAVEGETVVLRVWATAPSGQEVAYNWVVEAGRIVGRGHEVQWSFADVPSRPDPFQATVTASLASGESGSCSVQVFVDTKERGTPETGRSFLRKEQTEVPGYGLYSYVLFGSRPGASNRERYLRAIEAYLQAIEEINKLQVRFSKSKLNVAYLPVEVAPGPKPAAAWLLDHYDYVRARAWLDLLPGNHREGPYIVSVLEPLGSGSLPARYLFQDLSGVPAQNSDLISWWVREFMNQAAQEHFWQPRTAELFVLKMRTTIGILAVGLPEVQKALESWISWTH